MALVHSIGVQGEMVEVGILNSLLDVGHNDTLFLRA